MSILRRTQCLACNCFRDCDRARSVIDTRSFLMSAKYRGSRLATRTGKVQARRSKACSEVRGTAPLILSAMMAISTPFGVNRYSGRSGWPCPGLRHTRPMLCRYLSDEVSTPRLTPNSCARVTNLAPLRRANSSMIGILQRCCINCSNTRSR